MNVLKQSFERSPLRIFPHALAHMVVNTAVGETERHELLRAHFNRLSPADQAECRAEIARTKAAKRGELEAELVA